MTRLRSSATLVQQVFEGLQTLGVNVEQVIANLQQAGLPGPSEEPQRGQMPPELVHRFFDEVVRVSGDPNIGMHLGMLAVPDNYDVVGYVAKTSATLGDASRKLMRYSRLLGDVLQFELEEEGDLARFRLLRPADIPEHRQTTELAVVAIGMISRQLTGQELEPVEMHLAHDRPADDSEHRQLFGGKIYFNAPVTAFVFERRLLSLPVIGHDPRLCRILERQAEEMLSRLPERDSLVRRVQELITSELETGNPCAENVAEQLGISVRTLSRRLKALGTSHQALLDRVRCELATRYLQKTDLDVSQIAFHLGFSEASAFSRAFKRWTGSTPTHLRRSGGLS